MSIKDFNNSIATFITEKVGTMWCAYAFAAIALVSLPEAIAGGIGTFITWLSQSFIQLVLLSIVMVGQTIQGEKTESRAQEDHDNIMAELEEIKSIHSEIVILHEQKAGCRYTIEP